MSRLEEIKNELAQELNFKDWKDFCEKMITESKNNFIGINFILKHNDIATEIYARECSAASLEKASESIDPNLTYDYWSEENNRDKVTENIIQESNIVLL